MKYTTYAPSYTSLIPDYQVEQCEYEPYSPEYSNYVPDYRLDISFTTDEHSIMPLFKYLGGKRKLLSYNSGIARFLERCEHYVEPFVGAGAVYCYMSNNRLFNTATINDADDELINVYCIIRDDADNFIKCLRDLLREYSSKDNGEVRRMRIHKVVEPYFRGGGTIMERAGMFFILRRFWFNGVHKGTKENINFISSNGPQVVIDTQNIKNWQRALQNTEVCCMDYKQLVIPQLSFVYADPPYFAENATHRTGYKNPFANSEQQHCIDWCEEIAKQGSKVVLSNANADVITRNLTGRATVHRVRMLYATARRHIEEIVAVF